MNPRLIAQLRAAVEQMKRNRSAKAAKVLKFKTDYPDNLTLQEALDRIGQEGTAFEASQGYIDRKFIPNVNFNITDKRIAEINAQSRLRNEAAKRLQIRSQTRSRGPVTVQERIQPGTARSSGRFQGHSRYGRGGGGGFLLGDEIMGSKANWRKRRYPRNRNLSEVYTQGSGLLA
tara:strand:- start:32 stop:556 length:525 start_codon:yes stop_codon:yes gene_type:complete